MKTFPTIDIELTDMKSISDRIKSIDKQVNRLENISSRTMNSFDARHNKIKKLNIRKDVLWRMRAMMIREENKIIQQTSE